MASAATSPTLPWIETPLLKSNALSKAAGCEVYLKMEMFQPSGSFKSRGIGNLCLQALKNHPSDAPPLHIYSSSGGNAGLAAATCAASLALKCTVAVPHTTSELMRSKIRLAGAEVVVHGASWMETNDYLQSLVAADPNGIYVHPFDDPLVWEGHATMVPEVLAQLGGPPDGIITSVGGGGLFVGIMAGLEKEGLTGRVPVLAMETQGAESLRAAVEAGELVTLPAITSIATSLGAKRVCERAFELARDPQRRVACEVMSDAEAAMACVRLVDDERVAVEPACGVSVAAVYDNKVLKRAVEGLSEKSRIVVVLCGGSGVTIDLLAEWREKYAPMVESMKDKDVPSTHTIP